MLKTVLRKEVLRCFKSLHRTREQVFQGDKRALEQGRMKINEEFKKHKHVTSTDIISELIQYSKSVERELLTTVIQAREVSPGKYAVQIRPEIVKLDNIPFKDMPI